MLSVKTGMKLTFEEHSLLLHFLSHGHRSLTASALSYNDLFTHAHKIHVDILNCTDFPCAKHLMFFYFNESLNFLSKQWRECSKVSFFQFVEEEHSNSAQ